MGAPCVASRVPLPVLAVVMVAVVVSVGVGVMLMAVQLLARGCALVSRLQEFRLQSARRIQLRAQQLVPLVVCGEAQRIRLVVVLMTKSVVLIAVEGRVTGWHVCCPIGSVQLRLGLVLLLARLQLGPLALWRGRICNELLNFDEILPESNVHGSFILLHKIVVSRAMTA